MDWFRKIFGFPDRSLSNANPFSTPTWEEIMKYKESRGLYRPPDTRFHENDMHSPPGEFVDPFSSLFDQMDDMFSQLDAMMGDLHQHSLRVRPHLPDSSWREEIQLPRDSLLKVPDSDVGGQEHGPPQHTPLFPQHGATNPYNRYRDEENDDPSSNYSESQDFGDHRSLLLFDPQGFMNSFFQSFGLHPGHGFSSGHPDAYPENEPGQESGNHSRESLIKKEDSDIDDRVSGDLTQLPNDGPSYSPTVSGTEPRWSPFHSPKSIEPVHPGFRHNFYSKSIVTVRKPDGTVEETVKYSDSTGREEVTVTCKEPDVGNPGNILGQPGKPAGQDEFGGHGSSLFSWFFTR